MELRKLTKSAALAASLCLPAAPALAMSIATSPIEGTDVTAVWVSGYIGDGDAARFEEATRDVPKAIVFLEGPGGVTVEGLSIGQQIRRREYTTMVSAHRVCLSACALAWVAGSNLAMADDAQIGFHETFVEVGDRKVTSGVGNAIVGAYLSKLGVGDDAIAWMSKASPDTVSTLTPATARSLGVSVQVVSGDRVTRTVPVAAPPPPPADGVEAREREAMAAEANAAAARYAAAASGDRGAARRFDALYGPAVSLDGVVAHHDAAVAADAGAAMRAGRRYVVRPQSTAANCDTATGICSITGIMDWTGARHGSGAEAFGLSVWVTSRDERVVGRTRQPLRESVAARGGDGYQSSAR